MPKVHPEAISKNLSCGSCQWMTAGFDGKNCQKTRDVEISTVACIEYTSKLPDIFYDICRDKYILGVREVLRNKKFSINESVIDEIKNNILNDDFSKHQYGTKQDIESLQKGLLKIVSFRSRVSNLYTTSIDMKYNLEELENHVNLWVYSKYESIAQTLKNDQMRKSALYRLAPEFLEIHKKLNKMLAVLKYVDDKLDSNDQTLRAVLNSADKLVFAKENLNRRT
jgi:hypothetical protein